MADLSVNEVGNPLWWVTKLYTQITYQREYFRKMNRYYCGEMAEYPWMPEQYRREFSRMLRLTKSNYMGLVIDATAERLSVEGFRIGSEPAADKETWAIWQDNFLDSGSDECILEALIGGKSYLLVQPDVDAFASAHIYPEHMEQVTCSYRPGTGRRDRAAALKVWVDDWTGFECATLFLPDLIYKFQGGKVSTSPYMLTDTSVTGGQHWEPRTVPGELWPAPNVLGEVPVFEIANNPRMLTGGVSEIDDVIAIQDRICKTLADRLMTQDFGAFPQKWAIGFPTQDEQGNEVRIDAARDRMITSDIAETKFGQWSAAPLDPYSAAKKEDVKDIASRTRTPAQYLLGELNNVNGQTLEAAESGLVSKVLQRMRPMEQGIEPAVVCARKAAGLKTDGLVETIWRDPEHRTEGELVDALLKMGTLGVPKEALWEKWGASQSEIERWKAMDEEAAKRDPLGLASQALGQQQGGGNPYPAEPGDPYLR